MRRIASNEPSSLGRETTIRMTRVAADALYTHMRQDGCKEQMAFGLASHAKTAEGTLFLVNELVLPEASDLAEQSIVGICPTKEYQDYIYFRAQQTGKSIVEFHTHPGSGTPQFSSVDDAHGYPNAEYIAGKFQEPTTLLMVVGNNRFDAFDGIAFDRHRHLFRQIDRFEVLGRPNDIQYMGGVTSESRYENDAAFDRQRKIPGWNQLGLERQRIGIFGGEATAAPCFRLFWGLVRGDRDS